MDQNISESRQRQVRDVMTQNVVKVYPNTSVGEIARLMSTHDISGLPVVDNRDHVVGVITERDMIMRNTRFKLPTFIVFFESIIPLESSRHYRERLKHTLGTKAGEVMSEPAITITPDATIEELAELMVNRGMNPIPVVEQGRLVGIVSRSDIVRLMAVDFDSKSLPAVPS